MGESILKQYQNQWRWRDWDLLFSLLPRLENSLVYDLGCAHEDHSERLTALGAKVVGIDGNEELLEFARGRGIASATFLKKDIGNLSSLELENCDGVWASFVAAYFTDLNAFLRNISKVLKKGGWIAITEMNGLFDHEPLSGRHKDSLKRFYRLKQREGAYDFESGSGIRRALLYNGFTIQQEVLLVDQELSFDGPASNEILDAWKSRLKRMKGLNKFMADEYGEFQKDFLDCLKNKEHISNCEVFFYLATKVR